MSNHSAMFYTGADEFASKVSRFVLDGVETGDRIMVLAPSEKLHRLEGTLGSVTAQLDLFDSGTVYRPQARAIQVALDYLEKEPSRPTRLVAEQGLTEHSDVEVAAYLRQEAAANELYRDFPVTILCPYDDQALPQPVLTACRETHEGLLEDERLRPNDDYVDPRSYLRRDAAPAPPPSADSFTCENVDDLAIARRLVQGEAAKARLGWDTTGDLVLAVNEMLTNALTHGRPPARLYVYREGPALACHVQDVGRGPIDPLAGYLPPPQELTSGRGLWLARQLCDSVEIRSDATGSHVRLLMMPGD